MTLDKRPDLHDQIGAARHRNSLSQEDSMVHPHGAAPISAHQRKIAEKARKTMKRERLTSLDGCYVSMIERDQAEPVILKFEWLGDMGNTSNKYVGLFTAEHELIGVACFGSGPADQAKKKKTKKGGKHIPHASNKTMMTRLGGQAICLERGACVPYAPPNAASFLISRACKLMFQVTGVSRFFAYGDPEAGEYGAVYQASNWIYLGQGLNGETDRKIRYKLLRPGDEDIPRNWKTTRELRRPGRKPMRFKEARAKGYRIEGKEAKHVYAINVGPDAKKWRAERQVIIDEKRRDKPFPKPRPALTLKSERSRSAVTQSVSS